jgi:hypothetical protein
MPFQQTVNVLLNLGVPGDVIDDEPSRITPVTLATAGAISQFFTIANGTGLASLGGTITAGSVIMGGIAVNPKVEPLFGSSAANPLNPNLSLAANEQAALLTFGSCVILNPNAWNEGDYLQYNTTTGVVSSYSPSGAPSGGNVQLPNGIMARFGGAAGSLGIARLTN